MSRADFDYSEEETFADYEKIQKMVDNDTLGETEKNITRKTEIFFPKFKMLLVMRRQKLNGFVA